MPVQVTYDSELMDQLVPAASIPADRRFVTVLDENKRPLVFSIGNDNVFYLVIADENGVNSRQDLGARLGFNAGAQAFSVSQREDGKIIVVFAVKHASDAYGDLRILGPLDPAEFRKPDLYLRSFLLRTVGQPANLIFERVMIGPFLTDNNPLIIAVYRNANNTDIAHLILNVTGGTLTWKQNLDLPQNATYGSLTDLTPAVTVWGRGVFYLYKAGGQQSLVFITSDTDSSGAFYRVALGIPSNQELNSLSTYKDSQGMSRLLAAGASGLYQYKTIRNGALPTLLSNDALYTGVSNLFVAQSDDEVSVWFKNSSQTLGFHRGTRTLDTLFDSARPPLPLTTPGSGAQFSPIIDPYSKSQRLLIADSFGNLTLKEQANESQLWKDTPFVVADLEKNITIQSYTVVVKVTNSDGSPFADKQVLLASSAWVNVTVDGKNLAVSTVGVPVKTDAKGSFTIIVPTNDISSYNFFIKDYGGSQDFPTPPKIDPTTKVVAKLGGMTGAKLRDAKDADGNPLVSSSVAQGDLDSAAQAMSNMHSVMQSLPASTSSSQQSTAMSTSTASTTSSSDNFLWGAWNWIKEKVKSAAQWIVKQVGNAWRFIVTLAGKVWDFILDTAERVMKAVQFVFEKIGVAFEKLVQWLGFIFKWGDILEVSDGITSMVNGMLDFGSNFISKGSVIVEDFFNDLETSIRESTGVAPALQTTSANQSGSKDPKTSGATDSAPANWSNYQLNHNGVKENLRPVTQVSGDPSLTFIWTDLVQPIWEELKQRSSGLIAQVTNVYKQNPGASLGDVLKIVGVEVVLGLLGLIKSVAAGLIRVGAGIIRQIRNLLNQEIRVPVIGALFKLIAGGRPLTLLNAISLLIAVPVTIVAKIVTGEKPKRITNFDYDRLVAGTLDSSTLLAYNELADWVSTIYYIINGFVEIYKIATYQIPEVPESPTSPTLLSILLKLILAAFTFPFDRKAPRWPVRVSIWSVKAGHLLLGGALQRLGPSVKAIVAFDVVVGLVSFSLAQVVNDGEFDATSAVWSGKDDASTVLRTALSVLNLISTAASSYGQLAPDPFEKGAAVIVVGGVAAGESIVKGALAARKRANLT